jgi:hypothetical protein
MKVTSIEYKRTFNTGNFENVSIALRAEVQEGEVVQDVLNACAAEALLWFKARGGKKS